MDIKFDNKKTLKLFIESVVSNLLEEEEGKTENDTDAPAAETDDTEGGLDLDIGNASGDAGDGLDLSDTEDESAESLGGESEDFADSSGSSGGGLDLGAGGGSGGDPFSIEGSSGESGSTEGEETPLGPEVPEIPEDPGQMIVDKAIELLNQTNDDQIILNTIKSNIQDYFENFDDATAIIQGLWLTENPILKVVARKLLLFIKGN